MSARVLGRTASAWTPKARLGSKLTDFRGPRGRGGEIPQQIELEENRTPFALMHGGLDRRTLFICIYEWHLTDDRGLNQGSSLALRS